MDSTSAHQDYVISYSEEKPPVIVDIAWEMLLHVPVETAWRKVILEVNNWWAHSYKEGSTVLIEPFPGGRFWERFADGVNGAVYASVIYCEPPFILKCGGNWAMPGVGMSAGVWRFEPREDGTLLKSTGQMLGLLDVALMKERKGGSQSLMSALQKWVEEDISVERAK